MTNDVLLEVKSVTKSFAGFMAVNGVNLTVPKGGMYSIIGPNGAGKSTLFNLMTGHLAPNTGQVIYKGKEITSLPPYRICKMGIGRSFQRTNIFPRLTVFENVQAAVLSHQGKALKLFSTAKRMVREETCEILRNVGLLDQMDRICGTLAHGDQRQLELSIALASEPELLLLDEPTAGMSPQETVSMIDLISRIVQEQGLTLLFIEHDMEVVFNISHRITVMHQGSVLLEGKPEEIRRNPEVQKIYLGEETSYT